MSAVETATVRKSIGTLLVGLLCCVVCVTVLAGGAAAQTDDPATPAENESSVLVEVNADGAADVTVAYTFDLDDGEEQEAFDELRTDEAALAEFRDRLAERFGTVAESASEETGREMSVSNAEVQTNKIDRTGVVTVSLTWSGLAAVTNDQLTVTEPFASGFEPDRPLYVTFPDGYEVTSNTPETAEQGDQYLVWEAGTDLSGFEAVASTVEDSESDGTDETSDDTEQTDDSENMDGTDETDDGDETGDADASGPGFGLVAALVGIVGSALIASRRH